MPIATRIFPGHFTWNKILSWAIQLCFSLIPEMGMYQACRRYRVINTLVLLAILRGLKQEVADETEIMFIDDTINAWDSFEGPTADESFVLSTDGCVIPNINYLDPSIQKYVHFPKSIKDCRNSKHPLLKINGTHIRVWPRHENDPFYNITGKSNFKCCYKSLKPSKVPGSSYDNVIYAEYSHCSYFTDIFKATSEFAKIKCSDNGHVIFQKYAAFTPKKNCTKLRENSIEMPHKEAAYNVIILGMSSVSRLNFHRTMPKTLKFLQKKGVVELLGHVKISDNDKLSNLIPALVGLDEAEMKQTCWPNTYSPFDKCKFIWKWFRHLGYHTALVEDSAALSVFNINKGRSGFEHPPTDYYLYPFLKLTEINDPQENKMCMGDRFYFKVMLDYLRALTITLKDHKLFGVFWESTMSFKYLNFPMLMDEAYKSLMNHLDKSGYLNNTILIMMSDHGVSQSKINRTQQGRLEEKLPFVYILTPLSFRQRYEFAYENLRQNSRRLTTPLDIHSTLIDLMDLTSINNREIMSRSKTRYSKNKDISLFLPIPSDRTCHSAGVDSPMCACLKNAQIPATAKVAWEAGVFVIQYLNEMLSPHEMCAKLSLDEVTDAMEMVSFHESSKDWRDYRVTVRAQPGAGLFHATVRREVRDWALAGSITRLNLYGTKGHCVSDDQLKPFCYCTS